MIYYNKFLIPNIISVLFLSILLADDLNLFFSTNQQTVSKVTADRIGNCELWCVNVPEYCIMSQKKH